MIDFGLILHLLNQAFNSPFGLLVLAIVLLPFHIPAGFLSGWLQFKGFDPENLFALTLLAVFAFIGSAAACSVFFGVYILLLAMLHALGIVRELGIPLPPYLWFCLLVHLAAQSSIHIFYYRNRRKTGQ